jgi:surface protein
MNINEYFGFPEGTNAVLRYNNFYDVVDSNFPCQKDMSQAFRYEDRSCLKQINITDNTTNMSYMFSNCENLEYIEGIGNWDVSNVTNMTSMFNQWYNIKYIEGIGNWDVSNVTNMSSMFSNCENLEYIEGIGNWDTSKLTNMMFMFGHCSSLTDLSFISNWDTSKVTTMEYMFQSCSNLETLGSIRCDSVTFSNYSGMFSETNKLVNFGGLINLKSQLIYSEYSLNNCPNLSYQSCINVLNGLYDFVGNRKTPTSKQGKLLVHQNFLDKVGDEISIGTSKGWNIYA